MRTKNALLQTAALLVVACGMISGIFNAAAQHGHASAVNPDTLKWGPAPPSLPKGAQFAVLFGDPTNLSLFALFHCSAIAKILLL